jgi:hypothetical protein
MATIRRGVTPCELPEEALLRRYVCDGAYTDSYMSEIARSVAHSEYVEAFYTTAIFKVERILLKALVSKPSSDADVRRLARDQADSFAAWTVEDRAKDQLLLRDFQGRTRSWLMTQPIESGTRLYFGSAVVSLRAPYGALIGFHRLYSRMLLSAARSRLVA